jgi:hypothetical protein
MLSGSFGAPHNTLIVSSILSRLLYGNRNNRGTRYSDEAVEVTE